MCYVTAGGVTDTSLQTVTQTDLPGQGAVQYCNKEGLSRVEGGEEVRQKERRSRQEHQA